MLVTEFARAAGLTPDTVRFYVRRGLLRPEAGIKGGRNPYQLFGADQLRDAAMIRLGRSLGMTLREIAGLLAEERDGRLSPERTEAMLVEQRDRLRRRSAELVALAGYLDAKLAWLRGGSRGPQPGFPTIDAGT